MNFSQNPKRLLRYTVFTALAAYWSLIFLGTHLPHPPRVHLPGWDDKLVHTLAYFGLGFLLATAWMRSRPTFGGALLVFCVLAWYGAADELTQMLVPNRTADPWDWVADVTGGLCGIAAYGVAIRGYGSWLQLVRSAA